LAQALQERQRAGHGQHLLGLGKEVLQVFAASRVHLLGTKATTGVARQDVWHAEHIGRVMIIKATFSPPPLPPASASGHCPRAAPAAPPARGGSTPQQRTARRGTA
jgi:hypothetical protein